MNRVIQMILRMVMRKVMNKGINAGVNRMSRGKQDPQQQGQKPPKLAQSTRKRANMVRRLGRF